MIEDLKNNGVKTILVTEPFILGTSKRWQEAVNAGAMTPGQDGKPNTFDFYFGNTGLVDEFDPKAQAWFWGIYRGLKNQGVAGWWGDLGEPEVHPDDALHSVGSGADVHNAYGHQWAKMVYENALNDRPNEYADHMRKTVLLPNRFCMIRKHRISCGRLLICATVCCPTTTAWQTRTA